MKIRKLRIKHNIADIPVCVIRAWWTVSNVTTVAT